MLRDKSLTLGCLLCLVTFLYVAPTRVSAQTFKVDQTAHADRDQTLQQLLKEVRELRLAVQRATINNSRFQMLIERVRIQQGHVDALSRQLENVHSQVADMRAAKSQMEQQIKEAEDQLDRIAEPNGHADLESRIKVAKGDLARTTQEEERLGNRKAAIDAEFQTAQTKLNELNGQLDILMSELKAP